MPVIATGLYRIATLLKSHDTSAIRNSKIKIIQTITLKQESQPSSNSSKIAPIPLNIQPRIPPPVKMTSIKTRSPMIANTSIYVYSSFEIINLYCSGDRVFCNSFMQFFK